MSRKTLVGGIITIIIAGAIGFSFYISQINLLPQTSYGLFDQLPAPLVTDRILVVSPHQDDETLGVGGYLSQAAKIGATVEVIYATDGDKHGLKNLRNAEAASADQTLGIKPDQLKFYDYPDSNLSAQTAFSVRLKQDLDAFRPTIVFTTLAEDIHPDHAACGRAVEQIATAESGKFQTNFFLIHYHRYPRPIGDEAMDGYLLPPTPLIDGKYDWRVFPLDVQAQTKKLTAIKKYRSQLSLKNPILRQLLLSFDQKNELFATLRQP